jgi:hypothetical protein
MMILLVLAMGHPRRKVEVADRIPMWLRAIVQNLQTLVVAVFLLRVVVMVVWSLWSPYYLMMYVKLAVSSHG